MKKPIATSKASFKFGDVIVVPFPYSDKLAEKRRPALVVSSNAFNARQTLLWVVMITSADNKPWPDDVALPLNNTGLSSPSVVRPSKIATTEASRVARIVGVIDQKLAKKVSRNIGGIVGNVSA